MSRPQPTHPTDLHGADAVTKICRSPHHTLHACFSSFSFSRSLNLSLVPFCRSDCGASSEKQKERGRETTANGTRTVDRPTIQILGHQAQAHGARSPHPSASQHQAPSPEKARTCSGQQAGNQGGTREESGKRPLRKELKTVKKRVENPLTKIILKG